MDSFWRSCQNFWNPNTNRNTLFVMRQSNDRNSVCDKFPCDPLFHKNRRRIESFQFYDFYSGKLAIADLTNAGSQRIQRFTGFFFPYSQSEFDPLQLVFLIIVSIDTPMIITGTSNAIHHIGDYGSDWTGAFSSVGLLMFREKREDYTMSVKKQTLEM